MSRSTRKKRNKGKISPTLSVVIDHQTTFNDPTGLLVPSGHSQLLPQNLSPLDVDNSSPIGINIFHPAWWADKDGNHPKSTTQITYSEIVSEAWRPAYKPEWSTALIKYLEELRSRE